MYLFIPNTEETVAMEVLNENSVTRVEEKKKGKHNHRVNSA